MVTLSPREGSGRRSVVNFSPRPAKSASAIGNYPFLHDTIRRVSLIAESGARKSVMSTNPAAPRTTSPSTSDFGPGKIFAICAGDLPPTHHFSSKPRATHSSVSESKPLTMRALKSLLAPTLLALALYPAPGRALSRTLTSSRPLSSRPRPRVRWM